MRRCLKCDINWFPKKDERKDAICPKCMLKLTNKIKNNENTIREEKWEAAPKKVKISKTDHG